MTSRAFPLLCLLPLAIFALTFLALPLARLVLGAAEGDAGWSVYLEILRTPRYMT